MKLKKIILMVILFFSCFIKVNALELNDNAYSFNLESISLDVFDDDTAFNETTGFLSTPLLTKTLTTDDFTITPTYKDTEWFFSGKKSSVRIMNLNYILPNIEEEFAKLSIERNEDNDYMILINANFKVANAPDKYNFYYNINYEKALMNGIYNAFSSIGGSSNSNIDDDYSFSLNEIINQPIAFATYISSENKFELYDTIEKINSAKSIALFVSNILFAETKISDNSFTGDLYYLNNFSDTNLMANYYEEIYYPAPTITFDKDENSLLLLLTDIYETSDKCEIYKSEDNSNFSLLTTIDCNDGSYKDNDIKNKKYYYKTKRVNGNVYSEVYEKNILNNNEEDVDSELKNNDNLIENYFDLDKDNNKDNINNKTTTGTVKNPDTGIKIIIYVMVFIFIVGIIIYNLLKKQNKFLFQQNL